MPRPPVATKRPSTRYRKGDRDTDARQEHTLQSRAWRRSLTEQMIPPRMRTAIIAVAETTGSTAAAAAAYGLTSAQVYGLASWNPEFAADLEEALRRACRRDRPALCGTETGYKDGGHCARCRAAHHPRSGS